MNPRIVIIGAGGHAKVVCDAILRNGEYTIAGFVDAEVPVGTIIMGDHRVILPQTEMGKLQSFAEFFIVAIGNNLVREKLYKELKQFLKPAIVIHPTAAISVDVEIKKGSVFLANSVVNAFSVIGENTIINSGVVVDHECVIGDHVHLSIGTMVGSNATVASHIVTDIGQNINSFSKI
jgi:sugar O-acyltransferase (sialic acid O-acetyltransferase NeuD family)